MPGPRREAPTTVGEQIDQLIESRRFTGQVIVNITAQPGLAKVEVRRCGPAALVEEVRRVGG